MKKSELKQIIRECIEEIEIEEVGPLSILAVGAGVAAAKKLADKRAKKLQSKIDNNNSVMFQKQDRREPKK